MALVLVLLLSSVRIWGKKEQNGWWLVTDVGVDYLGELTRFAACIISIERTDLRKG